MHKGDVGTQEYGQDSPEEAQAPFKSLDLPPTVTAKETPSLLTEFAALSWRTWTDIWRNPSLLLLHAGMAAAMGVFTGLIFRNLPMDIAGAQGRLGVVFFSLCLSALTSLSTVDLLTNERGLAVREIQAGYYRPLTYYLSKGELLLVSAALHSNSFLD